LNKKVTKEKLMQKTMKYLKLFSLLIFKEREFYNFSKISSFPINPVAIELI